jgi:Tol biopolymer transport system component
MQQQTGLALASYDNGLGIVFFDKRSQVQSTQVYGFRRWGSISRDGIEIAASHFVSREGLSLEFVRLDGSNLREYPDVHPHDICWSYNKSKLAITDHRRSPDAALEVVDLGGNVTAEIDPRAKLTTQCWSPDDKKIVYEAGDSVRVYEIGEDKSTVLVLAQGTDPTWSPDGSWIAFLDHDTYYAIRPNGDERKRLFHSSVAISPLYWSPDSRIVAYVSQERFFEGGWRAIDADNYKLRVRRLDDNAEDWVAEGTIPGRHLQWVTNPKLLEQVKSGATSH